MAATGSLEAMDVDPPAEKDVANFARPIPTMKDKWELLPAFIKAKGLMKQHIVSFDYLLETEMKEIVSAESNQIITSDVDPNYFIRWTNCYVGQPLIEEDMIKVETTPHMCRLRDLTYASPIFCDVDYRRGHQVIHKKAVEIGKLPIMLQSKFCRLSGKSHAELAKLNECPYDPGGYFIIKGSEKVLLMQEQLNNNRIIVEEDTKKLVQAVVTSSTADNKSRTVVCQVPSVNKAGLYCKHSAFGENIPVIIMLKAMGMESDQEIVQMIGTEPKYMEGITPSFQDAHGAGVFSRAQAIEYLASRVKLKSWQTPASAQVAGAAKSTASGPPAEDKIDEAMAILRRQVLSHIPMSGPTDFASKTKYMCIMIRRVIDAKNNPKLLDDRDYYGNKRLELAGHLISLLFEDLFKSLNTELKRLMDVALQKYHQIPEGRRQHTAPPDVFQMVPTEKMTRGLTFALSSGNWNIKRFRIDRSGVSQILSRFSFISCIGSMTRVKSQFEKARKVGGPRQLQPSQFGMLCPADTPEGEMCGLVKNLSLMTHITTNEEQGPIRRLCYCLGVEDAHALTGEELHAKGTFLVFLNGSLLGAHRRPGSFMHNMRHMRRRGQIGEFISVYENEAHGALYIASDGGRMCRPLIICENGWPKIEPAKHLVQLRNGEMNFGDFLKQGLVEWVDVNEENNLLIAIYERDLVKETTHMEIDPLTLLGTVAGLIPHPNHNQSPRNTYQCAMGKQAMGCIGMNQFVRTDTILYLVAYPQKPLCKSKTIELINFEKLGAGQAASVAVMSYSGYDIEDASIMNKASIDRGYGRCYVMKKQQVVMNRYSNGTCDQLAPPENRQEDPANAQRRKGGPNAGRRRGQAILDNDGLCRVGEQVADGQTLINKVSPMSTKGDSTFNHQNRTTMQYRECPIQYKNANPSRIDRVVCYQNQDDLTSYKVMLRQVRRPELGDKFSSRHGQKGVVGLIVNQEDMPFSEKGWCPDMIMNPHG